MTVGKGVEQGGPGPVIPAREAGDLIASADEHPVLAARIHGPLHCGGILRARRNPVMLRAGAGSGMHPRWCSASLLMQRPPVWEGYLKAAPVLAPGRDDQRAAVLKRIARPSVEPLSYEQERGPALLAPPLHLDHPPGPDDAACVHDPLALARGTSALAGLGQRGLERHGRGSSLTPGSRAAPTPTAGTTGRAGRMCGIWATPLNTPQRRHGRAIRLGGSNARCQGAGHVRQPEGPVVGGASLPQTAVPRASNFNPRKLGARSARFRAALPETGLR